MKLCRFRAGSAPARVGLVLDEATLLDLSSQGVESLSELLEREEIVPHLEALVSRKPPTIPLGEVRLLCPLERQEVWAAGVTYLRSKKARMEESTFSATAYDRVYEAARPELFFKSLAEKTVANGDAIGIRPDSRWSVPEPELALVLDSRGRIAGYTIGNDVSARDIEGENLLYLPQAKVYSRSCAVGPVIVVGESEAAARGWRIALSILRDARVIFEGETSVAQIKRGFSELAEWLFRSQQFPQGAVLLTGTGIVPPDDFCLRAGDVVRITIDGVGTLENPAALV